MSTLRKTEMTFKTAYDYYILTRDYAFENYWLFFRCKGDKMPIRFDSWENAVKKFQYEVIECISSIILHTTDTSLPKNEGEEGHYVCETNGTLCGYCGSYSRVLVSSTKTQCRSCGHQES